jgi:hypothetical protein
MHFMLVPYIAFILNLKLNYLTIQLHYILQVHSGIELDVSISSKDSGFSYSREMFIALALLLFKVSTTDSSMPLLLGTHYSI